ncbi:phosphatase PAP2 family protein [Pontibacter sp. HSC-14F20]|uniref:phosphatase PAP2 family protein n=1 Tax=Pontibacter sp. HSC-14F20 TaxID=2864136 RepID=UPI001C734726|nr:phosphatase PAP2 family protein [Pontibacter sp. HSC-14F20]MBX0333496.1 phosphatase PAP2 family protein [Pontibacter sp. HSC-14F20]
MKKYILMIWCLVMTAQVSQAQNDSPYRTKFVVDAPITAAGMGLSYYGLTRMQDKDGLTEEQIANLNKNQVNSFDRFSAGWDSDQAKKVSDFPFYGSFALPFLLAFDDDVRSNAGQVFGMYVQTMAITGALFTMSNAYNPRIRPMVYSPDVEMEEKTRANARNSFYAGHTAASAAASFFFAKVFHDFNPDSPARKYVWLGAAAVPATVGYLRLRAGKHFLSDNLLGYAVGAAVGIVVPQLHKKSDNNGFSLNPTIIPTFNGTASQGANLSYTF